MRTVGKIVCRTVGAVGMSAVLYDAFVLARHHSEAHSQNAAADRFESIVATQRTNSSGPVANAIQGKVTNFRMNNPILPIIGKVKGFVAGFADTLGNNIIPISLASLALLGKNFGAKFGAWGLAIYGLLIAMKEGFGVGKPTPVDK